MPVLPAESLDTLRRLTEAQRNSGERLAMETLARHGATFKTANGLANLAKLEKESLPKLVGKLSDMFMVGSIAERMKSAGGVLAEDAENLRTMEKLKSEFLRELGHVKRAAPEVAERLLDHSFYSLSMEKLSVDGLAEEARSTTQKVINTIRDLVDPRGNRSNSMDARGASAALNPALAIDVPKSSRIPSGGSYFGGLGGSGSSSPSQHQATVGSVSNWVEKMKERFVQNVSEGPYGKLMMRQTVCYMGGAMALGSFAALVANQFNAPKSDAEKEQLKSYNRHYMVATAAGIATLLAGGLVGRNH